MSNYVDYWYVYCSSSLNGKAAAVAAGVSLVAPVLPSVPPPLPPPAVSSAFTHMDAVAAVSTDIKREPKSPPEPAAGPAAALQGLNLSGGAGVEAAGGFAGEPGLAACNGHVPARYTAGAPAPPCPGGVVTPGPPTLLDGAIEPAPPVPVPPSQDDCQPLSKRLLFAAAADSNGWSP